MDVLIEVEHDVEYGTGAQRTRVVSGARSNLSQMLLQRVLMDVERVGCAGDGPIVLEEAFQGVYGIGEARTTTRNHLAEAGRLADRIASGKVARPDFVVLPENTTDMDPYTDAETGRLVAAMSTRLGVPILFGAIMDGPGAEASG